MVCVNQKSGSLLVCAKHAADARTAEDKIKSARSRSEEAPLMRAELVGTCSQSCPMSHGRNRNGSRDDD